MSFPRSKEKKRRKKRREERRRVRPNEGFRGVRDMVRGDGQIGGCLERMVERVVGNERF